MLLIHSGRSFIKIQHSSFPLFPVVYPFRIATHYNYVKREKCKVNDVIFPFGCEARPINLGNKNMKISIFTGGTSVRSKNIFTVTESCFRHSLFDLRGTRKVEIRHTNFQFSSKKVTSKSRKVEKLKSRKVEKLKS